MAEYSTVSKMQSLNFSIFFNEMRIYNGSGIFFFYFETVSYTLMDIIYHIADFQKNILIVLTAFPLELKNK